MKYLLWISTASGCIYAAYINLYFQEVTLT